MPVFTEQINVRTNGKGTIEITREVAQSLRKSQLSAGTVTVFCKHTSCSLVIMENADPSARHDLHAFMEKLVPENLPYFQHTLEGADDMPSHIKMALTRTCEVVPFANAELCLGTWQGIFLWEHRAMAHSRQIVVSVQGE